MVAIPSFTLVSRLISVYVRDLFSRNMGDVAEIIGSVQPRNHSDSGERALALIQSWRVDLGCWSDIIAGKVDVTRRRRTGEWATAGWHEVWIQPRNSIQTHGISLPGRGEISWAHTSGSWGETGGEGSSGSSDETGI